ncbi:DUF1684 domain-containing protein [Coralloluteibacterium thermophilus]|uniref:DUF1684 domain-containing protein n=1 Tax=Coralloluteibacterium thermophilum TaxID=2707049 RepID=A0ABV9NKN5_9GAMM
MREGGIARAAGVGLALVVLAVLTGCGRTSEAPARPDAAETRERQAYRAEIEQWRRERLQALRRPDGWLSLVGLHWIERGPHYAGASGGNGIRLATGPAHLGMFDLREDGSVRFTPDRRTPVTVNDVPLRGPVVLAGDGGGQPDVLGFDDGHMSAVLIERGGRVALRVRDARVAAASPLQAVPAYGIDPAWRIVARFEPHPEPRTLEIPSVVGTIERMSSPGQVHFEKDGAGFTLQALEGEDGALFLILADRTSGHDTYGAGRYLDAPRPDAAGRTVLDFNKAMNPPCAFTAYATCPLPPPENRLELAVTAGEKRLPRES